MSAIEQVKTALEAARVFLERTHADLPQGANGEWLSYEAFGLHEQIDTALASLEGERGTVRVKALEWRGGVPGYLGLPTQTADTMLGRYLVEQYGTWCVYFDRELQSRDHLTEEAAKAAAQADYERRIRSALEGGNHAE